MCFKRKEVEIDKNKIIEFWNKFEIRSDYYIESFKNETDTGAILDEIELMLKVLYQDGYKGRIEFQFGGSPENLPLEFYLFHLNNRYLKKIIAETITLQPESLKNKWELISEQ